MQTSDLTGALTDPCPICGLAPVKGVNVFGEDATPVDGSFTVCFGCGLVQLIHDGMRCALTQEQADWLFNQDVVLYNLIGVAKMRAINPMRTSEIVREQRENQKN